MTVLWCPFAVRQPVPGHEAGSGPFIPGTPKIVHHTTEGTSYVGAFGAYRQTGDLPHFTDSYEGGVYSAWQHLPINVAASALKHPRMSGHTNRDNAIQIEHVGAAMLADKFDAAYLAGIGRLCRWIEEQTGCAREASVTFVSDGSRRLTWAAWHNYGGHLGHQHVPFNDHYDPGRLNIDAVLAIPTPTPVPYPAPPIVIYPEDHMQRIPVTDPSNPLSAQGTGFWDLDGGNPGRPRVAFAQLAGQPFVNGAEGTPAPDKHHSVEAFDHGGLVRLRMWGFEAGAIPLVYVPVAA